MTRTVLEIKDGGGEPDPEAREWIDAISSVMAFDGSERADFLLGRTVGMARRQGARVPFAANTAYINTIPPHKETPHPGNREIENRIRSAIRWNALAMVLRANKETSELGGHIASFQSAATLYDTGFMHFWHGATDDHGGDLVFVLGQERDVHYGGFYIGTAPAAIVRRRRGARGGLRAGRPWRG